MVCQGYFVTSCSRSHRLLIPEHRAFGVRRSNTQQAAGQLGLQCAWRFEKRIRAASNLRGAQIGNSTRQMGTDAGWPREMRATRVLATAHERLGRARGLFPQKGSHRQLRIIWLEQSQPRAHQARTLLVDSIDDRIRNPSGRSRPFSSRVRLLASSGRAFAKLASRHRVEFHF